ncbi:MAG: hypothetical protein QXG39_04730 [Candidatus Aenigmatarchaeota archaeon]
MGLYLEIMIILSIVFFILINPFNSEDPATFWAKILTWLIHVGVAALGGWIAKKHVEKYKKEGKPLFSLKTRGDKIAFGIALFLLAVFVLCMLWLLIA